MDEIEKRLKEAADKCIKCYESWRKDQKDVGVRETLNESLHELRRATAALEIEMIRLERTSAGVRSMPTPAHRAMRRRDVEGGEEGGHSEQHNDDIGNREERPQPQGGGAPDMRHHMRRSRPGGGRGGRDA